MNQQRPPIERMARISELLQRVGFFRVAAVAQEFEVSVRTIHRDIEFMRNRLRYELSFNQSAYHWEGQPPRQRIL
jgi:hypothetical protein